MPLKNLIVDTNGAVIRPKQSIFNDNREPYDPENPYQQAAIGIASLMPFGLYRPLEDRMRDFVRGIQSKNPNDYGEGLK